MIVLTTITVSVSTLSGVCAYAVSELASIRVNANFFINIFIGFDIAKMD